VFRRIRWRIALPYVALILLVMAGLTAYLSRLVRDTHMVDLEARLASEARFVASEVAIDVAVSSNPEALDVLAHRWAGEAEARVTIVGSDGVVLGESQAERSQMDNHLNRPEVQQALSAGLGASLRHSATEGMDMLYVAVPMRSQGQVLGVVRLSVPVTQVQAQVAQLQRAILAATLPATLLAVALAVFIAERTARPVRQLTAVAQRLEQGDLAARLVPSTRDEVGQLTGAFNLMATRLQEEMGTLATEHARLAAVLERMADGVLITDEAGRVGLLNPAAARLLRVEAGAAVGSMLPQVVRHYQLVELWQRARQCGQEQSAAVEVPATGLFLQAVAAPFQEGERRGYILTLQDLTRVRRLETVRRDFISNISHELRTPLASLRALADTLRDGALEDPTAARHFLDLIDTEVTDMTQMVQELLDLSRIEAGVAELNPRPTAVADLLAGPVERLQPQATRAGLTLTLDVPADLPPVRADAQRLGQVITNLLHNAIKFTPGGGAITVVAKADAGEVVIAVRDTGVGISADDLPRIFERFYKADRARSGGGSGLGLAIARHIVEAHHGRIWAESVEGRGSTFYVALPVASVRGTPSEATF
jgi:two-component system, OmpR family, phosphate regulon sensor histidine kinase PhoR